MLLYVDRLRMARMNEEMRDSEGFFGSMGNGKYITTLFLETCFTVAFGSDSLPDTNNELFGKLIQIS